MLIPRRTHPDRRRFQDFAGHKMPPAHQRQKRQWASRSREFGGRRSAALFLVLFLVLVHRRALVLTVLLVLGVLGNFFTAVAARFRGPRRLHRRLPVDLGRLHALVVFVIQVQQHTAADQ